MRRDVEPKMTPLLYSQDLVGFHIKRKDRVCRTSLNKEGSPISKDFSEVKKFHLRKMK